MTKNSTIWTEKKNEKNKHLYVNVIPQSAHICYTIKEDKRKEEFEYEKKRKKKIYSRPV